MYIKAVILTSSLHLKSQPFVEKKRSFHLKIITLPTAKQ